MKKVITIIITIAAMLLLSLTVYASPADLKDTSDVPTVAQLESALRHELKQYAADYIDAAQTYGIDVYFLCARDALESGWGRYTAASHNLGGWTDANGDYMEFGSVQGYIDFTARNISNMYLDPEGAYYNGTSLAAVNTRYNGSDFWLEEVEGIMSVLKRRCSDE